MSHLGHETLLQLILLRIQLLLYLRTYLLLLHLRTQLLLLHLRTQLLLLHLRTQLVLLLLLLQLSMRAGVVLLSNLGTHFLMLRTCVNLLGTCLMNLLLRA